jgi:hypothetical protein
VFDKHLQELQQAIIGQTTAFAATVADQFDGITSKSEEPLYPRLFSVRPFLHSPNTHLDQMILCLGAFCFFLHALDRSSFRPHSEKLRDAVFDSTAIELLKWFEWMVGKLGAKPALAGGTLSCIDFRNSQYGQAPSLLGASAKDRSSADWLAATAIAEDAGHPKSVLVYIAHTELLQGLADLKLEDRVKALEEHL